MRDIKFRAWGAGIYVYSGVEGSEFKKAEYLSSFFKNHGFMTLEQFTGLKDKNGKEIYEGDVVKNTTTKQVWENRAGEYKYHTDTTETIDHVEFDRHWCCFLFSKRPERGILEVIGNIHEGDHKK